MIKSRGLGDVCRGQLLRSGRVELEEGRSCFLAQSFLMRSEVEVAKILIAARRGHYDARHVCSACAFSGSPPLEKPSDDGESAKTAGLPMLDLLRTASPCNIFIMVTRYFDGIKLGTGGLVHAYATAVKGAFEQAVIAELLPVIRLSLIVDYGLYGKVSRLAEDYVGIMFSFNFLVEVSLCLLFRTEDNTRFLAALTELSGSSLTPGSAKTLIRAKQDGKLTPIQFNAH